MYLMLLNYTLQIVNMINFIFHVFTTIFKIGGEKKKALGYDQSVTCIGVPKGREWKNKVMLWRKFKLFESYILEKKIYFKLIKILPSRWEESN